MLNNIGTMPNAFRRCYAYTPEVTEALSKCELSLRLIFDGVVAILGGSKATSVRGGKADGSGAGESKKSIKKGRDLMSFER